MRLKRLRKLVPLSALLVLTAVLAACGSDSGGSAVGGGTGIPDEFAAPTAAPDNAKQGGSLTMLNEGDIDYMDPGAAYYQVTYIVTFATQRTLLGYQPEDTEARPDLADGEPEISSDNKTVTFHIQKGIKFSPPVNREVTTADIKYAIERSLLPGVANGYTTVYMQDVAGLPEAEKAVKQDSTVAPDISGIETPDKYTIIFHLTKPSTPGLLGALSLPVSAPVPEEYAKKFDAESPSTYGQHVVFTGPYMVQNNSSGELTGYTPGKEIKLIRNPNWDSSTDWRPAYLDSIDIQEGFADPTSASQKILEGDSQVSGDFPPSKTIVQQVSTGKYETSQMAAVPSGGERYIAFDITKPPFDNVNVRKAVIAVSDREALRNTRGGELFGPVATHVIPPLIPAFEESGGVDGFKDLDYLQNPNGNAQLAADYMKKAGYKSGKCEGDCDVTMVGDDTPPGKDTATVFQDQVESLGFHVTFQPVDHSIMYTKFCSVPAQQPNLCPNVGWIKDFNDPEAFFDIPFYGPSINPSNNSNWGRLDDPAINKAIQKARLISDPTERAKAYADINHQVMETADVLPWTWDNDILVQSNNVAGVANLFNGEWDLNYTSLK